MTFAWQPMVIQPNEEGFLPYFHVVTALQQTVFLSATFLTFYFFFRVAKASAIHVNFRIVLCCTAISVWFMGSSHFVLHVLLDNITWTTERTLLNVFFAFLCNLHAVGVLGGAFCMTMWAVELQLATHWVNVYEEKSKRIGVVLIAIVVFQSLPTGLVMQYIYVGRSFGNLSTTYDTCIITDRHPEVGLLMYATGFASCSMTTVWLYMLKRVNRQRTKSRLELASLSARFQQTQNSQNTASLAPSMVGYLFACLCGMAVDAARMSLDDYASIYDRALIKCNLLVLDGYALYHSVCFLYCNDSTRRQVLKDFYAVFGCKFDDTAQVQQESAGKVTDTYFEQFHTHWK